MQTDRAPKVASAAVASVAIVLAVLVGVIGGNLGANAQLLLVLLLVPVVILFVYPKAAIIILVLMMPFSGSTLIPRPLQNGIILGIPFLILVRYAARSIAKDAPHRALPIQFWLYIAMLTLGCVIGTFHLHEISPYLLGEIGDEGAFGKRQYVIGFFAKQVVTSLLPLLTIAAVADRRDLRWMPWLILGGSFVFVSSMVALFASEGATLNELRADRALFAALGTHSNTIGGLLTIPFAVALFYQEETKSKSARLIVVCLLFMILLGVLLTASRGAFVAIVAVSTIYIVKYRRIGAAFTCVLLVVVGLAFAPESIQERLLQGLDFGGNRGVVAVTSSDQLSSGRLEFWSRLAPEILNHPIFGNGLRSTLWSDYMRFGSGYKVQHPHNMYLEILLDTGIVGFFVYLSLWVLVWKKASLLAKDPELSGSLRAYFGAVPGVLTAYVVFGLTNGHSYAATEQIYLWVFVASVLVCPVSEIARGSPSIGSMRRSVSGRRLTLSSGYISRG